MLKLLIKRLLFFGFLLLLSQGLVAQEKVREFSLTQLLDSAVQRNYLLQANAKETAIKQAEIEILKTNFQPQISASASFSFWKFLLPNKERLLGNTLTDFYNDISVTQTIYDWGENKLRKEMVDDEVLLNDELRSQIRSQIIWGVSDAYFETLKAGTEIAVHQNSLEQLRSHLQYAENLYKIGRVSGVDVLKINVQVSVEEKAMQKAQSALLAQQIRLKRLCNLNESSTFILLNNSDSLFAIRKDQIFNAPQVYSDAYNNHPALAAYDLKMNLEAKQKETYRLQSRPEIFSYGLGSWEDGYLPFTNNFNYNIGATIRYTLPYWGGSSYKVKMLQSDLKVEQFSKEKKQAFLEIKQEIESTLNNIADLKAEVANNEKIIRLADETLKNAWVKYQAGQGAIVDVLDAESILTETSIAWQKSVTAYLQALAKLNYLSGNEDYPF